MAINPNTTFTSATLSSSQMNRLPWGVVGYVSRITAVSAISTAASDITGVTVTFSANSTRLYKFTFSLTVQKQTTAGWTSILLTDSSNNVIMEIVGDAPAGGYANLTGVVTKTGLSGSVTYKLRGACQNNTSNPVVTTTIPISLIVEDMGPA